MVNAFRWRKLLLSAAVLLSVGCGASAPDELRDVNGKPVPVEIASIYGGAKHCDTQRVTYVMLGDTQYVGDPRKKSSDEPLRAGYADRVALPADAKDTGYHSGNLRLFIAADGTAAYLVRGDGKTAKRLPKAPHPIGCQ